MHYPLFIVLILCLSFLSLYLGQKKEHRHTTQEGYFLAKRSLGVFGLTLTFLATQLGGGVIIGNAQAAATHGWGAASYSMGLALGLIVLSFGIGKKFRQMNVSSMPEIFSNVYNSPLSRLCATLLSIFSLFMILIALGVAAKKFFSVIGIEQNWAFLGFWSIAIIYTVFGGLSAVVKTDILQVLFIVFALLITALFFTPAEIADSAPSLPISQITKSPAIPFMDWLIMPLLFVIIGQDMGQRCYAAKDEKTVSRATFYAGILLGLLSLIPTYIGLQAHALTTPISGDESIFMALVKAFTNPIVASIMATGILMAILSTADSLVCSIGLNISVDLLPHFRKGKPLSLRACRIITFFTGLSALALSLLFHDVISLMVLAYKISIYVLFFPILGAAFLKNPAKKACIITLIWGIASSICVLLLNISPNYEWLILPISGLVFFASNSLQKEPI